MTFSLLLTGLHYRDYIIKLVRKNNRNMEYIHIDTKKVCLKIFSVLLRKSSICNTTELDKWMFKKSD